MEANMDSMKMEIKTDIKLHTDFKIAVINESMNKQIQSVQQNVKDNSAKTDKLVDCIALSNSHSEKTHKLIVIINDPLLSAQSKISENENKLTEVNIRVDQNRDNIIMTRRKKSIN